MSASAVTEKRPRSAHLDEAPRRHVCAKQSQEECRELVALYREDFLLAVTQSVPAAQAELRFHVVLQFLSAATAPFAIPCYHRQTICYAGNLTVNDLSKLLWPCCGDSVEVFFFVLFFVLEVIYAEPSQAASRGPFVIGHHLCLGAKAILGTTPLVRRGGFPGLEQKSLFAWVCHHLEPVVQCRSLGALCVKQWRGSSDGMCTRNPPGELEDEWTGSAERFFEHKTFFFWGGGVSVWPNALFFFLFVFLLSAPTETKEITRPNQGQGGCLGWGWGLFLGGFANVEARFSTSKRTRFNFSHLQLECGQWSPEVGKFNSVLITLTLTLLIVFWHSCPGCNRKWLDYTYTLKITLTLFNCLPINFEQTHSHSHF